MRVDRFLLLLAALLAPGLQAATPSISSPRETTALNVDRLAVHRDLQWSAAPLADGRGLLDVYVPEGADRAPVVIFVHGGALLFGDKSLVGHVGLRLAREGYVTVAINHRFSPAVQHPAHVQDAAAATRWVVDHIAEYGGDPQRIVLAGHSSGAYLAALLAVDGRWLDAAGVARERIRGLVPISGFFHVDRLAPSRPKHVWGEDPAAWVDASPAHRVTAPTPPTLLIHADGDDEARRTESVDFAAVLREHGGDPDSADVTQIEVKGRDHRSIFFVLGSAGDAATEALIPFLDRVTQPGA
ncbi:MAG TPA: alpha/beta hydrolase [Pseudomonadales bacterium]|nr:alpha/beta hydrolase [Pseudomonadales bacterium]